MVGLGSRVQTALAAPAHISGRKDFWSGRSCLRQLSTATPQSRPASGICSLGSQAHPLSFVLRENFQLRAAPAVAVAAAAAPVLSVGVQWLLGFSAFILSISASIFLISALPTLLAARRAALRMEILCAILEEEMPDTMKAMRLSGLELSDCIEEVTEFGTDVLSGLRASASAVVAAERGAKQIAKAAQEAIPALQAQTPAMTRQMELSLIQRAKLRHTKPLINSMAKASAKSLRATKSTLKAVNLGGKVLSLWRVYNGFRSQLSQSNSSRNEYQSQYKDRVTSDSLKPVAPAADSGAAIS